MAVCYLRTSLLVPELRLGITFTAYCTSNSNTEIGSWLFQEILAVERSMPQFGKVEHNLYNQLDWQT